MNRFQFYQKKIGTKLLLSKFVYPTAKNKVSLLRTTVAALAKDRDSEISCFGLLAAYGQFPTFSSSFHHTEESKNLQKITVTATGQKALTHIQLLVNKIIPFQIENEMSYPKLSKNMELNCYLKECTTSNDLNYLFFKYPLTNNTFNVVVQLKFSPTLLPEAIYYARLLQLPVETKFQFSADVSLDSQKI